MNDLVKFDLEKMAELGEDAPEESLPGNRLSTKDDIFSIGGQQLGSQIHVYVLCANFKNQYFDKPYDPTKIFPPACYALAKGTKAGQPNMVPMENAPAKQSDNCGTCWANQFKSKGKGKMCSNRRTLAVIPVDKVTSDFQIMTMEVPPTSLKAIKEYLSLATKYMLPSGEQIKLPIWAVKTEISLRAKKQSYTFKGLSPEEERAILYSRLEEANNLTMQPIDCGDYEPPQGASAQSPGGIQRFNEQASF